MAIEGQTPNPAGEPNPSPAPGAEPKGGEPNPQPKAGEPNPKPGAGEPNPQPDRRTEGLMADLQKERKQRQALQKQIDDLTAKYGISEKRVRALVGVEPKSEEEAEAEQVREQFKKMFPALSRLNDEQVAAFIERMMEQTESNEGIEQQYWADRAQQMTDGVIEAIEEQLGYELTERQKQQVRTEYGMTAHRDPEFLKRHERGDRKLIAEFAKSYVDEVVEPIRKNSTRQQLDRQRPVPGGKDRSTPAGKSKAIDFKNPKAVEDAMVESFRAHGGSFKE